MSVASILIGSISVLTSCVWSAISSTVGFVVSTTFILNDVSVSFPLTSLDITVTVYVPTFVGVPLIIFELLLNVTPAGSPRTSWITLSPLLSVASIINGLNAVLTSCVLLLIAFTAGGVLSITDIVIAGDTLAPLSIDVIFIVSFPVRT